MNEFIFEENAVYESNGIWQFFNHNEAHGGRHLASNDDAAQATLLLDVPDGIYQVLLHFRPHHNRSNRVPVWVIDAHEEQHFVTVDMKSGNTRWENIGHFHLNGLQNTTLTMGVTGGEFSILDAVKCVPFVPQDVRVEFDIRTNNNDTGKASMDLEEFVALGFTVEL